jgi:hypothetical protein
MSWNIAFEIKTLLNSPVIAISALRSLLQEDEGIKKSSVDKTNFKIIIDDDGNATLNFENPAVREEFAAHVRALSKVSKGDETASPSV